MSIRARLQAGARTARHPGSAIPKLGVNMRSTAKCGTLFSCFRLRRCRTNGMTRNRAVNSVVVLWTALFALSFVLPYLLESTGDGFTRGLNRITAFVIWQGIAIAVAIVAWLLGLGISREGPHSRWLSRIPAIVHSSMVLLAIGLVLIFGYVSPSIDTSLLTRPVTAPSPVVALPAEPAPAIEPSAATPAATQSAATVRRFGGIFRGGFEASHFYTMDGQGPWWLEAGDADWERINASYVDGPVRSGGVRVELTANGWLEDTGGEFEYLGIDDYRFHVVSIESIRALSEQEFDLVLDSITRR